MITPEEALAILTYRSHTLQTIRGSGADNWREAQEAEAVLRRALVPKVLARGHVALSQPYGHLPADKKMICHDNHKARLVVYADKEIGTTLPVSIVAAPEVE